VKPLKQVIINFLLEEDGMETVEYAVAGSLIVAGSVLAFSNLGGAIATQIGCLVQFVGGATACAAPATP